jgi:hypothetical protein
MAVIKHNGKKYPIPEGATAEAVFDNLKSVIPELNNAKLEKDGEDHKVKINYGKKG